MLAHEQITYEEQCETVKILVTKTGPFKEHEMRSLARSRNKKGVPTIIARVCSCGEVLLEEAFPGHLGGSNRRWTVKAKTKKGKRFSPKHKAIGWAILPTKPR